MFRLMRQCNQVDKNRDSHVKKAQGIAALYDRNGNEKGPYAQAQVGGRAPPANEDNTSGILAGNPFSLFSGVFPGTKWCGTGN